MTNSVLPPTANSLVTALQLQQLNVNQADQAIPLDGQPFSAVYAAALQQSSQDIQTEKINTEQAIISQVGSKKQAVEYEAVQDTSPFAMMFAGMVRALQSVSQIERKTNDLIKQYADRKVSVEEVSMATAQLNVSITLVTTVVSSLSQSIKELQNMQV